MNKYLLSLEYSPRSYNGSAAFAKQMNLSSLEIILALSPPWLLKDFVITALLQLVWAVTGDEEE